MTTKYRINWRAATGAEGHGQPVYSSLKEAQDIAGASNIRLDGIVYHWVEPVEVTEEEQCPAD